MSLRKRYKFTPPRNPVLRWLLDPGTGLPPEVAAMLLGELFNSPNAVLAGAVNGVILNGMALCLHGGGFFAFFIVIDIVLSAWRVTLARRAVEAAENGRETPTEANFLSSFLWCLLQGLAVMACMLTNNRPLQVTAAATAMGLMGPICGRNYAAPRWAVLLVSAVEFPFVAGGIFSGDRWLLVFTVQAPLFYFGYFAIIRRFQTMAKATMLAEHQSHYVSRHDSLTGLLNRVGLMEDLTEATSGGGMEFILFYLDLDGFKHVNDTFGHKAGDRLLAEVGLRLRASTRAGDIVARLGGDEFVVVAPGLPPASCAEFAQAIIRRVSAQEYDLGGGATAHVGVSVGFACCPEDGTNLDELQLRADTALYVSKRAGKGIHRRAIMS